MQRWFARHSAATAIACHVTRVESREEFVEAMDLDHWDLILSDHSLPSFDGISALKIAAERRPRLPFISS